MGGGWWIDETIKKRHSQLATTEVEFVHIISQRGMKHSKVFRGALYVSEIERLIQSLSPAGFRFPLLLGRWSA